MPDVIFKYIFLHENFSFQFHWIVFLRVQLTIMSVLVQVMDCCWRGDKLLFESVITQMMGTYASPRLSMLIWSFAVFYVNAANCIFFLGPIYIVITQLCIKVLVQVCGIYSVDTAVVHRVINILMALCKKDVTHCPCVSNGVMFFLH